MVSGSRGSSAIVPPLDRGWLATLQEALKALFAHQDPRRGIERALGIAARAADFDRAFIYEIHPHPQSGEIACTERVRWLGEDCPAGRPPCRPPRSNLLLHAEGFQRWIDRLHAGDVVAGAVRRFPSGERKVLAEQGIESVFVVPLSVDSGIWGFIEFDDLRAEREWAETQENALRALATAIGLGLRLGDVQTRLVEKEEILQRVLDNVSEAVFWKDASGVYRGCNSTFARLIGLRGPAEVIDRTDFGLPLSPDQCALFLESDHRVREGQQPESRTVSSCDPSGRTTWFEAHTLPLRDAYGRTVGVLGCWEDISLRRELMTQLQQALKMESLGHLTGSITHNFNNVLTAIIGYTRLALQETPDESPTHRRLQEIDHAVGRAASLVRELLTFSRRREAGASHVVHASDLVENTERFLRPFIRENIEFVTFNENDAGLVSVDPGQLEQVIVNLAVNGCDAMRNGGKLTIRTSRGIKGSPPGSPPALSAVSEAVGREDHVIIEVSDTGSGISKETQRRLFEPFFTTKEGGTGLGLSSALEAVRRSGGAMEVDSELGVGSRFLILLPRAAWTGTRAEPGLEPPRGEMPRGTATVLLVEDHDQVRELVVEMLRGLGYEVVPAAHGDEAFAKFNEFRSSIDVVVADMVMPLMGGAELTRRIREINSNLPVILTSGYAPPRNIEKLGPYTTFLAKPFSVDTLAHTLRGVLKA